jgi:hypothetical protein
LCINDTPIKFEVNSNRVSKDLQQTQSLLLPKYLKEDKQMEPRIQYKLPKGYWNKYENRRTFLDRLGKQLGFQNMNDWYRIAFKDIKENGGISLLHKYDDSPSKVLLSIYPEHIWNLYAFEKVPHGYWNQIITISLFRTSLDELEVL